MALATTLTGKLIPPPLRHLPPGSAKGASNNNAAKDEKVQRSLRLN